MPGCSSYGFYLSRTDGQWLLVPAGREKRTVCGHDRDAEAADPPSRSGFLDFLRSIVGIRRFS
jgi:hypothetical protein